MGKQEQTKGARAFLLIGVVLLMFGFFMALLVELKGSILGVTFFLVGNIGVLCIILSIAFMIGGALMRSKEKRQS